jgi:hypothetical protein
MTMKARKSKVKLTEVLSLVTRLSKKDLHKLHGEIGRLLTPDTSDFDELDWENVSRLRADGTDSLDAICQTREERDRAIADGEIET